MAGVEDRTHKDARTVEITVALVLGTLVVALPALVVWLASRWDRGGGDWSAAEQAVHLVSLLAGGAVSVGWLVRSERKQAGWRRRPARPSWRSGSPPP